MAQSIKDKFTGIGTKTVGSSGTSTEWNGIVNELDGINAETFVDLGKDTVRSRANGVIIGTGASDANDTQSDASSQNIGERVIIGKDAKGANGRTTAVGEFANALSLSSTAIGHGASVEAGITHGVSIGRGSWLAKHLNILFSLGTNGMDDFYFGAGAYHETPSVYGTSLGTTVPSTITKRYHGQDAFDARYPLHASGTTYSIGDVVYYSANQYISLTNGNIGNTPSGTSTDTSFWEWKLADEKGESGATNIDAGHVALCGGRATGTGIGGEVQFETTINDGSGAANTKQTLVKQGYFDGEISVDTRFVLLDVTDGTYKRVQFGADDSAGTGFKTLKVAN